MLRFNICIRNSFINSLFDPAWTIPNANKDNKRPSECQNRGASHLRKNEIDIFISIFFIQAFFCSFFTLILLPNIDAFKAIPPPFGKKHRKVVNLQHRHESLRKLDSPLYTVFSCTHVFKYLPFLCASRYLFFFTIVTS